MPHAAAAKHPSILTMLVIYVVLMVLLGLTVLAGQYNLGALGLVIALAIAAAKALQVVLVYMHVRYSSQITWCFAGVSLLWLGIMFSLTFSDYLMRPYLPKADDITANRSVIPAPPGVPPAQPMGARVRDQEHTR